MNRNRKGIAVDISTCAVMLTAGLCMGFAAPALAAPPAAASSSNASAAPTAQSAQQCTTDLRALDDQMQTDGYWLHGSGLGYGYPFFGYGYGYGFGEYGLHGGHAIAATSSHWRARPGYEVRTLIASATILAARGQQQACEAVLSATRDVYKGYAADLRDGKVPRSDGPMWRRQQIAEARPVSSSKTVYRSDQLIGADVVNAQGDDLGDVYDVVMSPQTGKISYLVVGRGGVFGIGENHIPVPWGAFKVAAGSNLMVLDTTKSNLDAAPRVAESHFSPRGDVGEQGQGVDAFWKTRLLK